MLKATVRIIEITELLGVSHQRASKIAADPVERRMPSGDEAAQLPSRGYDPLVLPECSALRLGSCLSGPG